LVELQRNPSGLRFFLCVASTSWIAYYCCATANSVIRNSYTFQLSRPKMICSLAKCHGHASRSGASATHSMVTTARSSAPSCILARPIVMGFPPAWGVNLTTVKARVANVCNKFARAALVARQAGVFFKRPS
jgi:hypothetical protein